MARTATTVTGAIELLQQAKVNIRTSIINKGIEVSSAATLDAYPALIGNIGGGLIYSATTATAITPDWGFLYQWTNNPDAITINSPATPSNSTVETIIRFTAGSSAPTISVPDTFLWYKGDAIDFEASKTYEIILGYDMKAAAITIIVSEYILS